MSLTETGVREMMDIIEGLKNLDPFLEDTLDTLADKFLAILQFHIRNGPFDTGHYLESWQITEKTRTSRTISSPEDLLFVILEYTGAQEHKIERKFAEALHWVDTGGEHHFAMWVIHPYQPPQPHFRTAIRDFNELAIPIINEKMKLHFKIFSS